MTIIARFDENGRYTCLANASPESLTSDNTLGMPLEDMSRVYIGQVDIQKHYHNLVTGLPTAMGDKPSSNHVFDYTVKQWVDPRSLQDLRDEKWNEIKQARDGLILSDLSTPYGVFDADAASSTKITQAVLLAVTMMQMQQVGSIDFTLADNSVASLTYPHMIEVGMALATREQSARSVATQIRAQIEASESAAEISNITWSI